MTNTLRYGILLQALLFGALFSSLTSAKGVYQSNDSFIEDALGIPAPSASVVWLTGERGDTATAILGHKAPSLRVRYWQQGQRSAWILNEIGKEQPISLGVIIDNNQIESIRVLEYREDRGEEVRFSSFTNQFLGLSLQSTRQLSASIDNITGATLSVRAVSKMARLALYLHNEVVHEPQSTQ